ncbi:MAG: YggS family pyridoxal phosphate-dependent enzyme [Clostridiales bacterium]|jgi:pyridoxal phosphate enzyme (YggS family)|nr:YggS family pyridoxal phosphate-dependent enzyme [Clostridiales bacterium]
MSIADNIKRVINNIGEAAIQSGHNPQDIMLVGVTKTVGVEQAREMLQAGVNNIGENRPQELLRKYGALTKNEAGMETSMEANIKARTRWHLIGHLQTNKVKSIIGQVSLIHSVDSLRLAEEIDKRAAQIGRVVDILAEINIAREQSKHGIYPEKAREFALLLLKLTNIRLKGLMCVAPNVENQEDNRKYFAQMRDIMIDINKNLVHNENLTDLSMGMTNDYIAAICEGATIVRVGTGIFGAN